MLRRVIQIIVGISVLFVVTAFVTADVPVKDADAGINEAKAKPAVQPVLPGVERRAGEAPNIPQRDPKTDHRLIDLSKYYTLALHEDSTGRYGYSLNMIKRGVQKLGNTNYDVRGIVQASSSEYADRNILFPAQIKGIDIGETCRTLCFLHASRWTEDQGTQIGSYIVHYANGEKREIPILFGVDLRDWDPGHDPGAAGAPAGGPPIAWQGKDNDGHQFLLYEKRWQNPLPNVQIESIDLISSMTTAAPFLVALTAQNDDAPQAQAAPQNEQIAQRPQPGPATLPTKQPTDTFDGLVGRLSSDDWKTRNTASAQLAAKGQAIEPDLRRVLVNGSLDAETRKTVEGLIAQIEKTRSSALTLVTLKNPSISAREAYLEVAHQAHVEYVPTAEGIWNDSKAPAAVDIDHATLWESLQQLSARFGIGFHSMDRDSRIVLSPLAADAPPTPAAAAGPFMVTISRIDMKISKATDFAGPRPFNIRNQPSNEAFRIYLYAWGEPQNKPLHWFVESIDECVTDTGQKFMPERGGMFIASGRINNPNETQLAFAGSIANSTRIARLRMTCLFVSETEHQKLEIPNVLNAHNDDYLFSGFRMTLHDVNKVVEGRYAYHYTIYRDEKGPVQWEMFKSMMNDYPFQLLDAQGQRLSYLGGSGSSSPNECSSMTTASIDDGRGHKSGPPEKIVWEYPSKIEQFERAIEFKDIPLP